MSKVLLKIIMLGSRMRNLYLKNKTGLNLSNYTNKGISVQIFFVRL